MFFLIYIVKLGCVWIWSYLIFLRLSLTQTIWLVLNRIKMLSITLCIFMLIFWFVFNYKNAKILLAWLRKFFSTWNSWNLLVNAFSFILSRSNVFLYRPFIMSIRKKFHLMFRLKWLSWINLSSNSSPMVMDCTAFRHLWIKFIYCAFLSNKGKLYFQIWFASQFDALEMTVFLNVVELKNFKNEKKQIYFELRLFKENIRGIARKRKQMLNILSTEKTLT